MSRLQWQRSPAGGFVAFPEGEQTPGRRAEIGRNPASGQTPWRWHVAYDTAKAAGVSASRQEAADSANEAWSEVKARGLELAEADAAEAVLRTMVQRMASKGDLPLSAFGIETSDTARLQHIIWLLTNGGLGSVDGHAKPLVEACSRELFRRRTAG